LEAQCKHLSNNETTETTTTAEIPVITLSN